MEGDLTPEMRIRIDHHLQNCSHCTAVYDGVRNVVRLLGNKNAIELPQGFSQRLYRRLLPSPAGNSKGAVMIQFKKKFCGDLDAALQREWLEPNGLGGFASST